MHGTTSVELRIGESAAGGIRAMILIGDEGPPLDRETCKRLIGDAGEAVINMIDKLVPPAPAAPQTNGVHEQLTITEKS